MGWTFLMALKGKSGHRFSMWNICRHPLKVQPYRHQKMCAIPTTEWKESRSCSLCFVRVLSLNRKVRRSGSSLRNLKRGPDSASPAWWTAPVSVGGAGPTAKGLGFSLELPTSSLFLLMPGSNLFDSGQPHNLGREIGSETQREPGTVPHYVGRGRKNVKK